MKQLYLNSLCSECLNEGNQYVQLTFINNVGKFPSVCMVTRSQIVLSKDTPHATLVNHSYTKRSHEYHSPRYDTIEGIDRKAQGPYLPTLRKLRDTMYKESPAKK